MNAATTTRITVDVTRGETLTYEFEGDWTREDAVERIQSGTDEPLTSNIQWEEIDVVAIAPES